MDDGNPTAFHQVLPFDPESTSGNQQLTSGISVEMSAPPTVPASTPFSQALDIHQLDDAFSSTEAAVSPRLSPTDSSMPVLERSDANADRSPLREIDDSDSKSPPLLSPFQATRSPSKSLSSQESITSPKKLSIETDTKQAPTKRKGIKMPETKNGTIMSDLPAGPLTPRYLSEKETRSISRRMLQRKSDRKRSDQSSTEMAETSYFNEPAIETDNQEIERNSNDPLLHLNRANSREEKCSEFDRAVDPSDTDAAQEHGSSSGYYPRAEGGSSADGESNSSSGLTLSLNKKGCSKSSADRSSRRVSQGQGTSSGYDPRTEDGSKVGSSSGYKEVGTIRWRASTSGLSKHASNAQMLLLAVLQKIMEINDQRDEWRKFQFMFLYNSKTSEETYGIRLSNSLLAYTTLTRPISAESRETKSECDTFLAFEFLNKIVVAALSLTTTVPSSLNFDAIFLNYDSFRNLCDKFSLFWSDIKVEDVPEAAHRNRLETLKEKIPVLLLLTKNAFQMLLMHVGEQAERGKLDKYEEKLANEDKKYLRRKA